MIKKLDSGVVNVHIRQDVDVSRAVEQMHLMASRIRTKGLLIVTVNVVSPGAVGAAVGGAEQSPAEVGVGPLPPASQPEPVVAAPVPVAVPAKPAKAAKPAAGPKRPWEQS